MLRRSLLVLIVCCGWSPTLVWAEVTPHPLFSDGAVLQRDIKVPVWGTAADGEEVRVTLGTQTQTTTAKNGKWRVELDPLPANDQPQTLIIAGKNTVQVKDVLVGEVWLCGGQSNMQWRLAVTANGDSVAAAASNPNIRLLYVPRAGSSQPQSTAEMAWTPCDPEHVREFSAVGYYFGRDLEAELEVPVGLIHVNYGGTPVEAWTSREGFEAAGLDPELMVAEAEVVDAQNYAEAMKAWLDKFKQAHADKAALPPKPAADARAHRLPMHLYNAMIQPLVPYAIRGVIWYQGEANVSNFADYDERFPNMIADWRKKWGYDFPFLFVQLAPYHDIRDEPGDSDWAALREAQRLTLEASPKTAMAVITDVGEEHNIHPKKKEPVGKRLALAALAVAYGRNVEYSGPMFESVEFKDGKAIVHFRHVGGGLVAKDGPLTGFTISGENGKFVKARAEIEGDTVVVSSDQVPHPEAVRFGWADYPVVNLWNQAGLPASPFRTDDFVLPSSAGR